MELGLIDYNMTDYPLIERHISDVMQVNTIIKLLNWRELDNGCWEWTGGMNKGRGYVTYEGIQIPAYRLSFYLFTGHWPVGDCRHLCGWKACICPEHLGEDGIITQNTLDTRFHKYLAECGLAMPFPLALRNWNCNFEATGDELYQIWKQAQ